MPQPRPLDDRDPYRATLRGGLGPVSSGGDGIGRPGGKQLEGPQSPQLTIRKSAPEEIQVGRPATFRLSVRNVGSVTAGGVQVRDLIPKGTQLVDTSPRALETAGGELVWDLGAIAPGDEVSVEMQVKPIVEGEIGSVATVTFHAQASVRTVATQPKLVVKTRLWPLRTASGLLCTGSTMVFGFSNSYTSPIASRQRSSVLIFPSVSSQVMAGGGA